MLSLRDLSRQQLADIYEKTAELLEVVETLTASQSVTGLIHHGSSLLSAVETRLNRLDPSPVAPAAAKPAPNQKRTRSKSANPSPGA